MCKIYLQKKGWINCEIFCDWMEHFIKHTKPSLESKVLLILDGHKSHTHNLKAVERAAQSGVIMLSLPPKCSHRMQPLDLTFFKPLKTYYDQQISQWLRAHPGRAVTMFQISQLFGLAYGKAASVSCAVNGFRKSGIFPLNPLVFNDADFEPAEVTDRPAPADDGPNTSSIQASESANEADASVNSDAAQFIQPAILAPASDAPCTSNQEQKLDESDITVVAASIGRPHREVSVIDISPLPKRVYTLNSKRRKSSKATLLTSSPHKRSIKATEKPSTSKICKKTLNLKQITKAKPQRNCNKKWTCLVCDESTDEDWIQCCRCKRWAHEACADITDSLYYYCDSCANP